MKVLIYCSLLNPGGGIRLLARLASSIAQSGAVDNTTLLIEGGMVYMKHFQALGSPKLNVEILPSTMAETLLNRPVSIKSLDALRSYLQRNAIPPVLDRRREHYLRQKIQNFDLMYAFWPHQQRYYNVGKPVVCTYQDTTFLDFPEILGGQLAERETAFARSWVENAHVVVSSNAVKEKLISYFGAPAAKARVVYHNILPDAVAAVPEDNKPVLEGLDLAKPYFLYPANINAHKNHDTLLKAWARFARRKEIPLVLIGDGVQVLGDDWDLSRCTYWRQSYLYGLVRRLGLKAGEDYFPLGYISDADVRSLMQHATALIMPSYAEGGGSYPVEEALMYGIPVLCSDIPVMREHLSQRSARISWFDPYSPDAILDSIQDMLDNYTLYRESAQAGRHDPRPTWADVAEQYVNIFQLACAKAV